MIPSTFQAGRLTLLRERAGMSKEELAQRCEVTRRTITNWESGDVANPPLETLAKVFEVDEDFFTRPVPQSLDPSVVSFRALSSFGARKTKRVLAAARLGLALSAWFDDNFETPPVDIPSLDELVAPQHPSDASPSDAAYLLRATWGLGDRPIKNMMSLVERHGTRVFGIAAGDRDVDAFSFWMSGRPFIFINTEKSAERLRFDLAHEVGHLVMHKGLSTAREKRYEFEANEFASAFLIPREGLIAQISTASRQLRLKDVMTLKKSWKVSAVAMVRRLFDVKVINDWHYRTWMVDLSSQGYRKEEPDGIARERSALISDLLSEMRKDRMTMAHLAKQSGVPRPDVEQAFMGLAFIPLEAPEADPCSGSLQLATIHDLRRYN